MTLGSHSGPSAQNYHKIVEENRNLTQRVAELEFFRDNLQKDWEHQRASIDATLHAMQTRFEVQLNVLLDLMNKVASTPCPMHSNTDSKSSKLSTIGERNVTEAVITTSTNSYTHSTVEHEKLSSTQLSVQTSRSEIPSVPKPGATGADKKSPSQLSPMSSIAGTPISNLASLSPLGLELADAMPSDPGVIVISVLPGSHADQAGLQPGDLIRSVNGVPVISRRAFREILEEETRHFAAGMDLTVINAELDEKVIRLPLIYESHTTSTA